MVTCLSSVPAPCDRCAHWDRFNHTQSTSWIGTGAGVCTALGIAFRSTISLSGGPDMAGNGWCSHTLNALLAYCCRSHFLRCSLFCSVGSRGIVSGRAGRDGASSRTGSRTSSCIDSRSPQEKLQDNESSIKAGGDRAGQVLCQCGQDEPGGGQGEGSSGHQQVKPATLMTVDPQEVSSRHLTSFNLIVQIDLCSKYIFNHPNTFIV